MKRSMLVVPYLLFWCWGGLSAQTDDALPATLKSHSEISTRLGLNSFNEINLHYELFLKDKPVNFIASIGGFYGSKIAPRQFLMCSFSRLVEHYAKRGLSLRAGFSFSGYDAQYSGSQFGRNHKIYLLYNWATANEVVIDGGCFSGSNTSTFEKYDFVSHDLGLSYYFDFDFRDRIVNFYLGVGTLLRTQTRTYTMRGRYYNPFYIPETEIAVRPALMFDMGMRIKLVHITTKNQGDSSHPD